VHATTCNAKKRGPRRTTRVCSDSGSHTCCLCLCAFNGEFLSPCGFIYTDNQWKNMDESEEVGRPKVCSSHVVFYTRQNRQEQKKSTSSTNTTLRASASTQVPDNVAVYIVTKSRLYLYILIYRPRHRHTDMCPRSCIARIVLYITSYYLRARRMTKASFSESINNTQRNNKKKGEASSIGSPPAACASCCCRSGTAA
jgi:hypothetical protein